MNLDPAQKARNEAFRKIGRNVVNYQRLEGLLKALLKFSRVHGTAEDLESRVTKQNSSIEMKSMGSLVGTMFDTVLSENAIPEAPEDTGVPWFSAKFEVELEQQEKEKLKRALADIVDERNLLIHQKLTHTNFNSIQSCDDLSKELESQRAKLLPIYRRIHAILKSKAEIHEKISEYLNSAELMEFTANK